MITADIARAKLGNYKQICCLLLIYLDAPLILNVVTNTAMDNSKVFDSSSFDDQEERESLQFYMLSEKTCM